jgi:hypothetical protein
VYAFSLLLFPTAAHFPTPCCIVNTAACPLQQASQGHLPTAAAPAGPPRSTEPKLSWKQRLQSNWQKNPALALACIGLFLALVAVILGVSIGVSARNKGRMPWWARGDSHWGAGEQLKRFPQPLGKHEDAIFMNWTVSSCGGGFTTHCCNSPPLLS